MHDWSTDVKEAPVAISIIEDPGQHFPRMQEKILLEEVIQTVVTRDLKFRSDTKSGAFRFGNFDGFYDPRSIALKI